MDKIRNFIDLEELDADDAKMRIIAQSFSGEEVWFRALAVNSIRTPAELTEAFLVRWDENKNPLQILVEYDSLKCNLNESVPDYNS